MKGAIERARSIVSSNPSCFMPQQFDNSANPQVHRETTAQEILDATEGQLDAFVAGVGTGGTITGVGEILKAHRSDIQIVAIEPERAQALSGGPMKPHGIQGIGAGFIPAICNQDIIDQVFACDDEVAYQTARSLAREEGISAGISAGANVWGALQLAKTLGPGKRVVTIICDAWDRYISLERPIGPIPGLDFII